MPNIYALGPFRLDTQVDLLFRGTEPLALGRRAIALLRALLEQPGAVVSKDALIEAAWRGQAVEESNLTVQISALRRALGAVSGGAGWIETMPRRGYRFVGPVCAETENRGASAPPPFAAATNAEPTERREAERRQITALSCELVGAPGQGDGIDLEDLGATLDAFRRCVAETGGRCQGFVANHLGNAALVLFGYPVAHEDDAERAVRAGLELCAASRALGVGAGGPSRGRVGIATRMAIVGDPIGSGDRRALEIVGNAPDLAVSLRVSAQPDTVVIGPATRDLIGGLFDCRDLGTIDPTAGTEPIRVWQVLGDRVVESRFEALRGPSLNPLVGREDELELLLHRWRQAKTGDGQVVLLSGEPGIGKSRLASAFLQQLEAEPHASLRYFCSPHHSTSALYPVIGQLEHAARFERGDSAAVKLDKLAALLLPRGATREDLALLAELLSLPVGEAESPACHLTQQERREQTLNALLRQIDLLAAQRPTLVLFEDAHWADPSSRELLDLAIDRVLRLPVLLIVTCRADFDAPWVGMPGVASVVLAGLRERESALLAQRIAGRKTLPAEMLDHIVKRADGIPLFIEELTKTVLENRFLRAHDNGAIPMTLNASLLARIDRLGPAAREAAQIGAAIGREFSLELVAAVSERTDAELQNALAGLADSGLVFARRAAPRASYRFKHVLVRDIAYGTLLRGRRQSLHAAIGNALEEHFPETAKAEPERLAGHFTEAALVEKAVSYWERAGHRSLSRPAMVEAIAQLNKGLELLATLPPSDERSRKELDLLVALAEALHGAKGTGGEGQGRVYARARELTMQLPNAPHLVPIFYGGYLFELGRNTRAAREIGIELLRLGSARGDATAQMVAHRMIGTSYWHLGDQALARPHLETALAAYDPSRHRTMHIGISNTRGTCFQYLSGVLILLGYPDQAVPVFDAARAAFQDLVTRRPRSLQISSTYFNFCVIQQLRRDVRKTGEYAQCLVDFAKSHGPGPWASAGRIWRGWVRFTLGEETPGAQEMREGLEDYRAAGSPHVLYYFLVMLADIEARLGLAEAGLRLLEEAAALQDELAAGCFASDLLRVQGDLLALSPSRHADAESSYRGAIALARQQQTLLYELRAAMSLARLRRGQRRAAEARDMLVAVYRRFGEGIDTPDLREAKALLDALAGGSARRERAPAAA